MSIYSFQTTLLSAAKTGNPPLATTSLSATGVTYLSGANVILASRDTGVVSLSTTDVGLVYTPTSFFVTTSAFTLAAYPNVTVNVLGSVFNIPASLHNTQMAVVKDNDYSVFTFLSSVTTVAAASLSSSFSVSTSETRRKRMLGY